MLDISIIAAFIAGIVSFLSPCVLPIIPGFLGFLAQDATIDTNEDSRQGRFKVFLSSVYFVLGFSVVFAVAGVILNTVFRQVAADAAIWFSRIGGAIIIFFGLYLTKLIRIPFLEKNHSIKVNTKNKSSFIKSFSFGSAFALGWTPCVGAVLGAILGLAASQPGTAFSLLMSYALGLGIPFLIVGALAGRFQDVLQNLSQKVAWLNFVFGIILIALGVLIFGDQLSKIANFQFVNSLIS